MKLSKPRIVSDVKDTLEERPLTTEQIRQSDQILSTRRSLINFNLSARAGINHGITQQEALAKIKTFDHVHF